MYLFVLQEHWLPYMEDRDYDLNEMCTRDSHLWRARCPMICFFAVEWHFVDRVARQFGRRQGILIEESNTTRKRAIDGIDTNGAPDKWCAISIY